MPVPTAAQDVEENEMSWPDAPKAKSAGYAPLLTLTVVLLIALILALAAGLLHLLRTGALELFLANL
ncbi:MAG: hypothetical protein ACYC5M_11460 [Anaerolineae bacterium]